MRLLTELQLDFDSVLIRPNRSTLTSRSDVNLERDFIFKNSNRTWSGIPIMSANMDTTGTFEISQVLKENKMFTCLHKHYELEELFNYFFQKQNNTAYSMGITETDLHKWNTLKSKLPQDKVKFVCIDVANGYTQRFIDYVKKFRDDNPYVTIIAGNVVTSEITEELILNGVDIVKVGIGPGCFTPDTEVLTENGWKPITSVELGEKVLTHQNTWEPVTRQWNFTHHNKMTTVEVDGNSYEMTPDHKVFCIHSSLEAECNSDEDIQRLGKWVAAKDLSDEWFVVTE